MSTGPLPDDSSDIGPTAVGPVSLPPCPIQSSPVTTPQQTAPSRAVGGITATAVAAELPSTPLPTPEPMVVPELPQSTFIPQWWQQWAKESVQAGFPEISVSIGLVASVLINLEIHLDQQLDIVEQIVNESDGSICGQCSRCCEQCENTLAKCNEKIDNQLAVMLGEAIGRLNAITGVFADQPSQPAFDQPPPQPQDINYAIPATPTQQHQPDLPAVANMPQIGQAPFIPPPPPPQCYCPNADTALAFYGPGYYYIYPQQYPVCICISCEAIASSIARAVAIALNAAFPPGPISNFAQALAEALKIPKQDIPPPAAPPDKTIYESDVHYADGEPIYTQGLDEFLRVDGPIMPIIVGPEAWVIPDQQDPNRVLSDKKE